MPATADDNHLSVTSQPAVSSGPANWPLLLVCLAVASLGMAPAFVSLWPKWWDSFTYSHGLLIVAISLWLMWRQRDAINDAATEKGWWAIPSLLAALFLWTLSFAASVAIGIEAMLPAVLWLTVAAVFGLKIARRLVFPIGFLYFAIPAWDLINGALLAATVSVVDGILDLLRVPAWIQGNTVQIPSGAFEIAGGCSGLHFFIVALAISALYGHLYYRRFLNKGLLIGIAALFALLTNWLRVSTIIIVGHLTEMQSFLVKVDHYYFGWVLFGLMLIPFFYVARSIELREANTKKPPNPATPAAAQTQMRVNPGLISGICVMLLLPALVWGQSLTRQATPVTIELPAVAGWHGPLSTAVSWQPHYPGASGETLMAYRLGGIEIDVYANWYVNQAQGRELIGFGNDIAGLSVWRNAGAGSASIVLHAGGRANVREIVLQSSRQGKRLVWYWYQAGSRSLVSPAKAKLWQGWQAMWGDSGTGLVALSMVCASDCTAERQTLTDSAGGIYQEIKTSLHAVIRAESKTGTET
ncbi:MAG: EpsI family protein [Proteobacteria bacterium]|nr:EpsI family protein [Pseudomonadota bacterium]